MSTGEGPATAEVLGRARATRLLVLDVDGVLTDGRLYFSSAGSELKAFSILDGLGVRMLRASGVEVALVTGRESPLTERRAREMGVERLVQNAEDKLAAWEGVLAGLGLAAPQCAYMGDDLPDLPAIRRAGLGLTVPSAPALVREHAHYVTAAAAGAGAVREACELIMRAQGTLAARLAEYLS